MSNYFYFILITIRLLRILLSSSLAFFEIDFKKIIALRTLSQISFCFLVFSLGYFNFSFWHIIRHALFKRCLFIEVGLIIFFSFGQQDYRNFKIFNIYLLNFRLLVCLLILCGLIFSRGILRKDLLLEFFYFRNFIVLICLIFFKNYINFLLFLSNF